MLKFPVNLTPESFLSRYWQKQALSLPKALDKLSPSITRNELGWLATLDGVESRLVFVAEDGGRRRYRVEDGPFDPEYLSALPKRNWTLLVHDVEKHLPDMRRLFQHVPFIPGWRIDDLMVSFAAPGGGVGPHKDQYDVFLCQGIGVRSWQYSGDVIADDGDASDDLALLSEFDSGCHCEAAQGDILYLPPGVAHWGTAKRACMTYSIGMRAPALQELAAMLGLHDDTIDGMYMDPDLSVDEAHPGYLSSNAVRRAETLLGLSRRADAGTAVALGRLITRPKDWLHPEGASADEIDALLTGAAKCSYLNVHGMALLAFDDNNLFANGENLPIAVGAVDMAGELCVTRRLKWSSIRRSDYYEAVAWMLAQGVFEIPEFS